MAEKTLNTRQKQKYDTSTNWTTNNPVLLAGELGIESDTNKFKIGNGTSAWNELDYAGGGEVVLYSTTGQNTDGAMTQKATTDALPQAVSFDLSPELNFDSISMTNEQFNLLLANPENVLIVNVVDDNDDTMTFSWIFHRSQYMKITTDEVTQELLTFNCDEATQAGSVAQVIQNLTFVRLSTSPDIVVMDYRIDFTSFATRSDLTDYVPKTRTINGKSLANNITLTATDVNALPDTTEIPTALSDLTEDSTHRTVTDTEKSTWNAKSDFSGSYNDLTDKPDISPNLYDLIITNQTEFDSFCLSINNSTCTAASVLFVGDGGDLEFTKSDGTGIQLPTTLKIISGINNAIINLGSISTNGLYYETRPTSDDYSINNITIRCSSSTAGNDAVISNCINLTNVTALSIGSVATLCPSAFKNCYYLNYCIANGAAMSAYDNCRYLHDCRGTSTGSYASSDTYSFCTYLDGCYGDSNASTYDNCTNLVGCRSNSGYRGFYNCKQLKSCSSTASYRSYDDCYNLYDCEANRSSSTSTTWYGFENCDRNVFPHFSFGGTQIDINKLFTGTVNNTIFIDNYDSLYKFYDSTGTQQTIASLNDIPEVPSLTNYVTTNTSQTITAVKYFDGLIHFLGETNNLDNITSQNRGITISSFAGGISTAPTTDSSGIVINYYVSNTYRTQLVLMNDEQASTWRRSYINGNWTAWKQISGNSVDIGNCTLSYNSTNSALEFIFE